jgi:hypothetical protein
MVDRYVVAQNWLVNRENQTWALLKTTSYIMISTSTVELIRMCHVMVFSPCLAVDEVGVYGDVLNVQHDVHLVRHLQGLGDQLLGPDPAH